MSSFVEDSPTHRNGQSSYRFNLVFNSNSQDSQGPGASLGGGPPRPVSTFKAAASGCGQPDAESLYSSSDDEDGNKAYKMANSGPWIGWSIQTAGPLCGNGTRPPPSEHGLSAAEIQDVYRIFAKKTGSDKLSFTADRMALYLQYLVHDIRVGKQNSGGDDTEAEISLACCGWRAIALGMVCVLAGPYSPYFNLSQLNKFVDGAQRASDHSMAQWILACSWGMECVDMREKDSYKLLQSSKPEKVETEPLLDAAAHAAPRCVDLVDGTPPSTPLSDGKMSPKELRRLLNGEEEEEEEDPTAGIGTPCLEDMIKEGFPVTGLKPSAYHTWLVVSKQGQKVLAAKKEAMKEEGSKKRKKSGAK